VPEPLPLFYTHPLLTPPPSLSPYTTLFRSCALSMGRTTRSPRTSSACGSVVLARSDRLPRVNSLSASRASRPRANSRVASDRFRSEEHTSELQSRFDLVCRLLLEKKN